jgi:hypothetical protein
MTFVGGARVALARAALQALVLGSRGAPVSDHVLRRLRAFAAAPDALVPHVDAVTSSGVALANPFLSDALRESELGDASLPASVLNFLERRIRELRPSAVLEFGSGISTACIARFLHELHGRGRAPYVVALEEDAVYAEKTARLLASLGLAPAARVIHVPVRPIRIDGRETRCYALTDELLEGVLAGASPDLVLVDGPSVPAGGSRFATLPLARSFLQPGARFFLDDALRDHELEVAVLWRRSPGIVVEGLHLIGKGILAGRVERP